MIDLLSIIGALPAVVHLLAQASPAPSDPADDFSPLIFVMLLVTLAACCFLLGVGLILTLVGIVCTAVLIALGLVSSSVVFALLRRRVSAGVRALHYQVCALMAAPAGVALVALASAGFRPGMSWRSILPLGVLAGCVAGLLVAGTCDWAARLAHRRLLPTRGSDVAPAASLPG